MTRTFKRQGNKVLILQNNRQLRKGKPFSDDNLKEACVIYFAYIYCLVVMIPRLRTRSACTVIIWLPSKFQHLTPTTLPRAGRLSRCSAREMRLHMEKFIATMTDTTVQFPTSSIPARQTHADLICLACDRTTKNQRGKLENTVLTMKLVLNTLQEK